MNRRGFLRGLVGGVAVAAAAPTFPFRVFSFPTEIVIPEFTSANAVLFSKAMRHRYAVAIEKELNKIDFSLFDRAWYDPVKSGTLPFIPLRVPNLTT